MNFAEKKREADQSVTSLVVLSVWNEASEYLLSFSPWGSFPPYSVHQRWGKVSAVWCTPTSSLSSFARSLSTLSILVLNEFISGDSWPHLIYIHCWWFLLFKERGLKTSLLKIEAKQQLSISSQCAPNGTRAPALLSTGHAFFEQPFATDLEFSWCPVNSWCSLMSSIAFLHEWARSLKPPLLFVFAKKTNLAHVLMWQQLSITERNTQALTFPSIVLGKAVRRWEKIIRNNSHLNLLHLVL